MYQSNPDIIISDTFSNWVKNIIKTAITDTLPFIINELELRELRLKYPTQIKSDQAAQILGITQNALNQRVFSGQYRQGVHFKLKGSKIRMWDRDTLLEMIKEKKGEVV